MWHLHDIKAVYEVLNKEGKGRTHINKEGKGIYNVAIIQPMVAER